MNLHVWRDEPADGPHNMAADELLAAAALRRGGCCVRVYGWTPTTVSLGAFQNVADARHEVALAGVPLVRRPSGGGAIVHGSDLTYAVAIPKSHPCGSRPQLLYDAFHEAMRQALAAAGIPTELWPPTAPSAKAIDPRGEPLFCFDRRAVGDVVFFGSRSPVGRGYKVMGSAQRRLAATVLQHGSLLLRRNRRVHAPADHPGLEDLAGRELEDPAVLSLTQLWLALAASRLGMEKVVEAGRFLDEAGVRAEALRFADQRWLDRR